MSPIEFFTGSGVLAWLYLAWRAVQFLGGLQARLRWALWGHQRPKTQRS